MRLEYPTYEEAKKHFKWNERWEIFDGNRQKFNIAHQCIDRHPENQIAIRIKFGDGRTETYTFGELSKFTCQFANLLKKLGVSPGDKVALLMFPSIEFYTSMFGIFRRGAVVVPCYPLFGPEAVAFRLEESRARAIVTTEDMVNKIDAELTRKLGLKLIFADDLMDRLKGEDSRYDWGTNVDSMCMIQFSSGTTGAPKSVMYQHGAITVSAVVVRFHLGLSPDDTYFCPSTPAWGHGLWFGTIGPMIFGRAVGTLSGKFDAVRCLEALEEWEVTKMAAISSHYRLIMGSGKADKYDLKLKLIAYTGEPMTKELINIIQGAWGLVPYCSYGTTEAGPITLDYGAFDDWVVKPGSLGRPMIKGRKVAVLDDEGNELPAGKVGQIALWREGEWVRVGDSTYIDGDGYFWYVSRTDDVIISAGYTIGPIEVEESIIKHHSVAECAVVASPDKERGSVVKAFIKLKQGCQPTEDLAKEIQEFVKERLSKHEYPREIEFIEELPKTPEGKIKRKDLRIIEKRKKLGD